MNINLNFTIPDPLQLLVYLLIALIIALFVGGLAGMRSGLGYLVTIVMAALGAWVFASFLRIQVVNDVALAGVPIVQAALGALIFGLVSVLLVGRRREVIVE